MFNHADQVQDWIRKMIHVPGICIIRNKNRYVLVPSRRLKDRYGQGPHFGTHRKGTAQASAMSTVYETVLEIAACVLCGIKKGGPLDVGCGEVLVIDVTLGRREA